MILVEFLQKSGHDGRTVKGSLGVDIEPPAVFRDYRHFTVIQIDDLTMPPQKGGFLLFQVLGVYRDIFLFPAQTAKFCVKLEILRQFPCNLLRIIVTLHPYRAYLCLY